jgi:exonuclease III
MVNQNVINSEIFPQLTFSAINCNSLNMSATAAARKLQRHKIYGIAKLRTDIILLSDIRMSNRNNVSCSHDIEKILRSCPYGQYNFIFNSTKNSRGVGILYKNNINLTILGERRDMAENMLLVSASVQGSTLIIGSIYGPNGTDRVFYDNLSKFINELGDYPVILGGDWNTVNSGAPLVDNPDVLNMRNLPGLRNRDFLLNLMETKKLVDPYRIFYPNRRDFTYVPRDTQLRNRSRLDFFLVSENAAGTCHSCEIAEGLQSKLFDHKAISIDFKSYSNKKKINQVIDNSILCESSIYSIVKVCVIECYTRYSQLYVDNEQGREDIFQILGRCRSQLFEAGCNFENRDSDTITHEAIGHRDYLLGDTRELIENLPWEAIKNSELTINDDIFLETLMSDLKNDICSFQSHLKITRSLRRTNMIKKLNNLKLNYRENAEEIFELESKLNKILHSELICELEKYQLFEQVNSEKISPFYLKLAKSGKPSKKLSDLKKNDGCNFENEGELKKFVFDYYAGLYKKNENNANIYNGCIRDFLGEDIYNHPIVQDSILTLQEREMLEAPLTSQELEKAVKESNKKSSVGIDGIGYPFIIQFWEFLGTPLLKYAHCCFASGKLTSSFSTAVVKLIPKKVIAPKLRTGDQFLYLAACIRSFREH